MGACIAPYPFTTIESVYDTPWEAPTTYSCVVARLVMEYGFFHVHRLCRGNRQRHLLCYIYIHTYIQWIDMGKLVYAVWRQQHVWTRRVWCCENARGVGRRLQSSIDRLPPHKTTFFTFIVYRILEREVVPLIHRNYSPLQKQGEKKPQKQAFLLVVFVQHTKLPASAAVCLHKNIYSVLQFIIAEAKSRLQVRSKDTQHQKRIE